jgi:predicted nucleic-acid-binding Zn-ribbon protein
MLSNYKLNNYLQWKKKLFDIQKNKWIEFSTKKFNGSKYI